MGPGRICILVLCILLYFQDTLQAKAQKCRRTNKKPFRYCLDRQCTSDSDCRANHQCLCDGDCGLSCVQNGTDCGKLDTPKALRVRLSEGTKFGSVARFSCKGDQYTLRGSKKRVCRGIGKWDGKDAKCRILCKHPGDIAYGNNNGDKKNYRVGATVRYWCFPGYDMEGQSVTECNNKGKWKTPAPKCEAPSCSKPIPPDNAFIYSRQKLKEKYKYNEVVRFRCEHGHYTSGSSFQRCLASGWSNSDFRCIPKSCGDPGSPVNGKRQGYVFTFKRKVYFKCNRGYKLDGPEYRQCQANQKWSDRTPSCEPIKCRRLKDPKHGEKIEETSISFGGKVVFRCTEKGFELNGPIQRVCQENGQWSGINTTCERVECKIPTTPHKGEKEPEKNKYVYEDRVEFRCDTNYTLIGNSFIICQHDKIWTGDAPRCLAPCKDPGTPNGGMRLQHSFLHSSVVNFKCNSRWSMEGSPTIKCTDGRWDHDAPTCSEGCTRPKRSHNGGIYTYTWKNFYDHKDRVRFYCYRYYKLVGDEYTTCRDGYWTSSPPECKRLCGNPGKPVNGGFTGSEYFEGRETSFYCHSGFDLFGSQTLRCLPTGRWSKRRPECKSPCDHPWIPYNAAISNPLLTRGYRSEHGTTISFTCNPSYTLEGRQTIRCDDGRWSSGVSVCKAPCPDPGDLQYGKKYGSNFLHGQQVTYTCLGLYMLEGPKRLTCNDGRWDQPKPSCKAPCSDPGSPAKGNKRGTDYRHGKSVFYTCQLRTRLEGRSSSTCNNGKWSSPLPSCLEICPILRNPKNGHVIRRKSEYLSGHKATFQCNSWSPGYDLFGNMAITCNRGEWSAEIPSCLGRCQVPRNVDVGVISSPTVISGRRIKHGTRVSFSCSHSKMMLDGEREITCNDRTWSSSHFPSCKVPCSDPGPIINGNRESTNFTVKYECLQGYTLVGSSRRNCVGGRWSSDAPRCFNNCPNPGSPTNGHKTGTDYRHGQRVFYRCTGRTRLKGDSRSTCNDGQWSSPVPICLEICPTPSWPNNGRYLSEKSEQLSGDKVVYECYSGYDLIGNRELHCDRGRWNGSAPICADRCKIKHNPSGVKFVTIPREPGVNFSSSSRLAQGFRHGTLLTFSCIGNKMLNSPRKILCNQGRWSNDFPRCEVPCKSPLKISNGKMRGSQFRVQYECDSGYTLLGNSDITCNQGQWSSDPPSCMSDCSNPGRLNNGRVAGSDYRHGHSISFSCYYGFRLNSSNVLVCNDGRWNDTIPTCIGVCQSLSAPKNGERLDNNFDYNARVRFKCNKGYDIKGPKMLICSKGIWSNVPPVCKGRCVDPGVPRHGRRKGHSFKHQETVDFFCNYGYELFGESFLRCKDGVWSHLTPTCEAGCLDPGVPAGMTRKGLSLRSRSSLTYSCIPPFHISGNSVITCKDGNWSDSLPTCSDCMSALGMESGKIPDSNIQASSTRWNYHAKDGRLKGRYAWCSGTARKPYLEIDFGKPYRITALATQGSAYDNKWVENYTVTSNLAGSSFNIYGEYDRDKIFIGNRDKGSVVKNKLSNPVIARRLRILPKKQGGFSSLSPACMRVEIYGCELPSDCIQIGSRVVAKWISNSRGGNKYLKAYLTGISRRYWEVELEDENHASPSHKYLLKYEDLPFVLDVPPKHEELQVGTRVLAPWGYTYFTGTIKTGRDRYNRYRVRADDDDDRYFTLDQIRVLKAPTFCN